MGKKLLYMILGLIVAIIVIAECFSNNYVKTNAIKIEEKVSQKIEKVLEK